MRFHENFHEFVLVGISGITIGNFKRFEFGRRMALTRMYVRSFK